MSYFAFVGVPGRDMRFIRSSLGLRAEPVVNQGVLDAFPTGDTIAMVLAEDLIERADGRPTQACPSFAVAIASLARAAVSAHVVPSFTS
jgi:hypothetical protein